MAVCLGTALVGNYSDFFLMKNNFGITLTSWSLYIAQLLGIFMLIMNSQIQKTVYWKVILFCLVVSLIGGMLKILHLEYANEILLLGMLGIVTTYIVRFIYKKNKGLLDILKLLWVMAAYTIGFLILLHYLSKDYFGVASVLFWLMIIYFVFLELFRKQDSAPPPLHKMDGKTPRL